MKRKNSKKKTLVYKLLQDQDKAIEIWCCKNVRQQIIDYIKGIDIQLNVSFLMQQPLSERHLLADFISYKIYKIEQEKGDPLAAIPDDNLLHLILDPQESKDILKEWFELKVAFEVNKSIISTLWNGFFQTLQEDIQSSINWLIIQEFQEHGQKILPFLHEELLTQEEIDKFISKFRHVIREAKQCCKSIVPGDLRQNFARLITEWLNEVAKAEQVNSPAPSSVVISISKDEQEQFHPNYRINNY